MHHCYNDLYLTRTWAVKLLGRKWTTEPDVRFSEFCFKAFFKKLHATR